MVVKNLSDYTGVHFKGRMSVSQALQFKGLCDVFQVLISEKTREAQQSDSSSLPTVLPVMAFPNLLLQLLPHLSSASLVRTGL